MGWNYQEVLDLVQNLGLQDHVKFTGYVSANDLPVMYNLAEFFVYPSLYEGFGLPPLEALACGTPVITSAVSSMPEHVGDCGILVPPNDPLALSSAIQQLANDEEKRLHFKTKGPQQAENFTWKRTAHQTLQLYHRLDSTEKLVPPERRT
jgi:glycosyltransferase involved in cell wall biosynthesis